MSNNQDKPLERREGYKELLLSLEDTKKVVHGIKGNQTVIQQYLEVQFGGKDLIGIPMEGNVTRALREINEKIKIQNGRVSTVEEKLKNLEDQRLTFAGICIGAGAVISWFLKLIWK